MRGSYEKKLKGFNFTEVWDSEVSRNKPPQIPTQADEPQAHTAELEEKQEEVGLAYPDAVQLVMAGKAIASGKWKLQKDKTDNILLGELVDGEYRWIDPVYYPPIFRNLKWREVELSEI